MLIDLTLLAQYDTPTICNAIELFDVRPRNQGYMDARIRACFPEMPPAVGYASTATMRCAFPRREGDVYSSLDEQADKQFDEAHSSSRFRYLVDRVGACRAALLVHTL